MDLNSRIIIAVKECPTLYNSDASIAQRQRGWKKLSDKLRLQEDFLVSRWHYLLEQFKRVQQENVSYFKYKKDMEFLLPYLQNKASSKRHSIKKVSVGHVMQPEFVITAKDIAEESDNEEYVFLEVETLDASPEVELQKKEEEAHLAIQCNEEEQGHAAEDSVQQRSTNEKNENISQTIYTNVEPEPQATPGVSQEDTNVSKKISVGTPKTITLQKASVGTNNIETEENRTVETKECGSGQRNEDDIFGELVAAMLKRFPAERKRVVKKGIMNLLLT